MTVAQATFLIELIASFGLVVFVCLFILEVVTRDQLGSSNILSLRSLNERQRRNDHKLAA